MIAPCIILGHGNLQHMRVSKNKSFHACRLVQELTIKSFNRGNFTLLTDIKKGEIMGKGLSPLQRFILKETYKKQYIKNADILIKRYGFQPLTYGKIRFSRKQIGMEKYICASASVSNSLTRLRKRGLLIRGGCPNWGHCLTKEGIKIVKENKA